MFGLRRSGRLFAPLALRAAGNAPVNITRLCQHRNLGSRGFSLVAAAKKNVRRKEKLVVFADHKVYIV